MAETNEAAGAQTDQQQKVSIRYEQTNATYASQFVINATLEEIIINFSAGYINDPQTQQTLLPVHSRIAVSPSGAARLVNTLSQALRNLQESQRAAMAKAKADAEAKGGDGQAGLPTMN